MLCFEPQDPQMEEPPYGLSQAEQRVLTQLAEGLSDKQIALQIGASRFTINKHVTIILGKMRVRSRTQAAVRAIREGALPGQPVASSSFATALGDSALEWATLIDLAKDPILVADENGRFKRASVAALDMLGIARDDLVRLDVPDLVLADVAWSRAEYKKLLRNGRWFGEAHLRRSKGAPILVQARSVAIETREGRAGISVLHQTFDPPSQSEAQPPLLESIAAELTAPAAVLDALAAAVSLTTDTAQPEQVVSQIVEAQSALRRASIQLAELSARARDSE